VFNLLIRSSHISLVSFKVHYLKCRLVQIGTFNGNKIPLFLSVLFHRSLSSEQGLLLVLSSNPACSNAAAVARGTVLGGLTATMRAPKPQRQ